MMLKKINGDWGLGIGDWGLGPIPNPQSPIPTKKIYYYFFDIINLNLINAINNKCLTNLLYFTNKLFQI